MNNAMEPKVVYNESTKSFTLIIPASKLKPTYGGFWAEVQTEYGTFYYQSREKYLRMRNGYGPVIRPGVLEEHWTNISCDLIENYQYPKEEYPETKKIDVDNFPVTPQGQIKLSFSKLPEIKYHY